MVTVSSCALPPVAEPTIGNPLLNLVVVLAKALFEVAHAGGRFFSSSNTLADGIIQREPVRHSLETPAHHAPLGSDLPAPKQAAYGK